MIKRRSFKTLNLISIDKEALIHNVRLYQSLRPEASVCPVLKSNAYGHGLTLVASHLDPLGLDFFVVDSIYEAYQLRDAKIHTPILILGYTHPENFHRRLPFQFTAFDEESLRLHAELGHEIHLEVETGMNRMGIPLEELPHVLEVAAEKKAKIVGLFSHLATGDHNDESLLRTQERQFQNAIQLVHEAGFDPKWIHLGNSAGSLRIQLPEINALRLGVGLFGIDPNETSHPELKKLRTVAEVRSTIVAIQHLKAGESVSYGASFTASKPMSIAVVPFGYYEGLDRGLSNSGFMEVNQVPCPIVGRVCMNHSMIDISSLESRVAVGDEVIVYSRNPDSPAHWKAQSKKADTIAYELMVRLSESVRRSSKN